MDILREEEIRNNFKKHPFLELIGARLVNVEKGRVSLELNKRQELTQMFGYLHGGVLASIADSACCNAASTMLDMGWHVVTVELKTNYLRPASSNGIRVEASVLKAGKSLVVSEAEIFDMETGKLLNKTMATLKPVEIKKR